jgi:N6-adenosine-specific RNA methylase IME4
MAHADIAAMPVAALAADDAALFMWATFPKLAEGLEVIRAWGFEYRTCAFVWIKANRNFQIGQTLLIPEDEVDAFWGMGRWTRSNAELCLLGLRGKPKRMSGGVHQLIYAPIDRHSAKPRETYRRIEALMGDVPKVELFCRNPEPGWDVFGNEVISTVNLTPSLASPR